MRVAIVYPLPFNLWALYHKQVSRFTRTFKDFPPEYNCELYATCHWGEPVDSVRKLFYGIKTRFTPYYEDGCDIGAALSVSSTLENCFVIGMPTHAYFHRAGWLKRFMAVVEENGPGLYGASGSFEIRPHIRTAGYGMPSEIWHRFPFGVYNRDHCTEFENGDRSITDFCRNAKVPVVQVTWDDFQMLPDCRKPPGIFRRGEQNAMLWWDRHTELYAEADAETKQKLEDLADGIKVDQVRQKE